MSDDPASWGAQPVEDPSSWGAEPVGDAEAGRIANPIPEFDRVPQAFIDRIRQGKSISAAGWFVDGAREAWGEDQTPLGLSEAHQKELQDLHWLPRPAAVVARGAAWFGDLGQRLFSAAVHGAASTAAGYYQEWTGASETERMQAQRDADIFAQKLMVEGGISERPQVFVRPAPDGPQVIGELPKAEDFTNAATALTAEPVNPAEAPKPSGEAPPSQGSEGAAGSPDRIEYKSANAQRIRATEKNLQQLWEEKGITPSEAAHDAQSDAFLKADLTDQNTPLSAHLPPEYYSGTEPTEGMAYRPSLVAEGLGPSDTVKRQWAKESPIKTIDDLFTHAQENQDALARVAEQVGKELGLEFTNPGVKKRPRVEEKIDRGKAPGRINDVVRGGFIVETPAQSDAIVARMAQHFEVVDEGWFVTPQGYFDRKALVRFSNGQVGELQFWHPDMFEAKEGKGEGHKLYVEAQNLPVDHPRRVELDEQMRGLYSDALRGVTPEWKALFGNGGSEGNLASKAALESTRPPMPISELSARDQAEAPSSTVQASPGRQTNGSPSKEPYVNAGEAKTQTSAPNIRHPEETDKQFAKRVVDKRTPPATLPEDYAKYFNIDADTKIIPLDDLISSKTAEENAQGAENGAKRMAAASAGELSRRAPIEVQATADGKYVITDGNGTYSSVKRYGWKAIPAKVVGAEAERPSVAGADVTRPESLPTFEEQPPPPPGALLDKLRDLRDSFISLGNSLVETVNPMVTGSPRSMVAAKDYADTVRRIDWEWQRYDQQILKSPELKAARDRLGETAEEQRRRMWNAADEESVLQQEGLTSDHMGIATVEPEERAMLLDMNNRAQRTWMAARDLEMVQGEGLPFYTPRMLLHMSEGGEGPVALGTMGRNLTTRTGQMIHREHMTAEETEAAAKALIADRMAKRGASVEEIETATGKVQIARDIRSLPLALAKLEKAIAGRQLVNDIKQIGEAAGEATVSEGQQTGFFTIEHPALKTWRPRFEKEPDGTLSALKDENGDTVFDRVPIYISDEFKGPLTAILDNATERNALYQNYMKFKAGSMRLIMNSPMIHNLVVWGKVLPSAPGQWLGLRLYTNGNRIIKDATRSSELVQRGLAPIGRHGSFQEISSIMQEPTLRPGELWESEAAGMIGDLFSTTTGDAWRRSVDKAMDFYHNDMLWDRVRDVQFGLADHLSRNLQQKGLDSIAADRVGSYFSNAIVGSIPKEAMSSGARMIANTMLFSRSFTLGNWQVIKTAATGLPAPLRAQLERDMGISLDEAEATQAVRKIARGGLLGTAGRMALGIIAIDYIVAKVTNSLFQNAANVAFNDSNWSDEYRGYARRLQDEYKRTTTTPWELLNPLDFNDNILGLPGRLASNSENEPGKENRIKVGYDKDGSGIYLRNPMGKYPEEVTDWFTGPMDTLRRKLSPTAGAGLDVLYNTQGLGRKVYDETAQTTQGKAQSFLNIVEHMIGKHTPELQLEGAWNLLRGDGNTVDWYKTFAPFVGFTASQGYPGGPIKGVLADEKRSYEAKFDLAWPEIRKQIKGGNLTAGMAAMNELGVPAQQQRGLIRAALNPSHISGRSVRDFILRATPDQQNRFFQMMEQR